MTGTGSTRRRSPARLGRLALGRVTTRLSLVKAGIELGSVERRVCRATRSSDLAVVVHVYYSEVWAEIAHRLRLLGDDVDLYVTLAGVVRDFEVTVLADFPAAHVMVVPNVGRDVLPFITVARGLRRSGYTSVLKLHTKRSVHADDGAEFLAACLDDLVPSAEVAHQCRELVTSGGAALVGPQSRYYPLAIHVWLNHGDLDWFLARRGHTPSAALQHPSRFGFFAGTMFWANLDRVAECLDVPVRKFQVERAQIDGTMAHALERLFAVVPELDGQEIWASGADGCQRLSYDDHTWPAWALRRPEME